MSVHTPHILKARNNHLITGWAKDEAAELAAFNIKIKSFAAEMGVAQVLVRDGFEGSFITGYIQPDPNAILPEGWRCESHNHEQIVPSLRTKAGKAAARRLKEDFSSPVVSIPGLPDMVWGHHIMGRYVVEELGGDWYAKLNFQPKDTGNFDVSLWEEVPRSTYYLALEAEQEKGA